MRFPPGRLLAASFQSDQKKKLSKKRISNNECRISKEGILSILFKDRAKRFLPSTFDSAESFDPESFDPELTTEGLVAGCGSIFDILRFAFCQLEHFVGWVEPVLDYVGFRFTLPNLHVANSIVQRETQQ